MISETSKVRRDLSKFCNGVGLDIGFGGDPIVSTAICLDLKDMYTNLGDFPQHISGDGKDLSWFQDYSLDYIYSSHLLEDFNDTKEVLLNWIKKLKSGGKLILFLPDQVLYEEYCKKMKENPNSHHKHSDFSLDFIKSIINHWSNIDIIYEKSPSHIYSFELVIKRIY